jgi:peroxiredoxin Q/BCP
MPVAMMMAALSVGTKAPAVSLESTSGKKISLADYAGQTVVLAFFPKAFTGG